SNDLVVVTGATGFLGAHVVVQLLAGGYRVRGTVRSPERESDLRQMVRSAGGDDTDLGVVVADLAEDRGWAKAVGQAGYVIHGATPVPASLIQNEAELIGPARDGTVRVLAAAREAGVKRVVLTSSAGAIASGGKRNDRVLDETDWTDPDAPGLRPYIKS